MTTEIIIAIITWVNMTFGKFEPHPYYYGPVTTNCQITTLKCDKPILYRPENKTEGEEENDY